MTTDRIEKEITLKAPRSKVWRALTESEQFSAWFGVKVAGKFEPGAMLEGVVTNKGYEHMRLKITVQKVQPESLFSYTWHPHPIDMTLDYSKETPTLVEFHLSDFAGGTRLTVTESGFDKIPEARRASAIKGNEGGWAAQMVNIERYVSA
jgi:uncharacterized protein YndB with AHSA1/START domain